MTDVLHIIDALTPADMLDQLELLADAGETIVSLGPPPRLTGLERLVRTVHCPLGLPQLAGLRMGKLARGARLVHAWSVTSALAAWALGRTGGPVALLSLPHLPAAGRALGRIRRLTRRAGLHLTVPTRSARAALMRAGLDGQAVHVLPPPAPTGDDADTNTRRSRARKALGLSDKQHLLVSPAAMVRGAGHKYASWVHAIIRQLLDDVLLLMPAGGPIQDRVQTFAATTGYDGEVFLPEDAAAAGLSPADALAAADIAMFPAERDTGVAALAAAMAAGLPIVASRTPDIAECAPHETAALLASPADPREAASLLLKLIETPDLAEKLSAAARRRAGELFDVQVCRGRLEEIYTLTAGSAGARST